ncbi:MAG: RES family NAD+ phosphorylase [Chromatiales bacterium]|jgi:RES domain-containing protein|nr:RES family NAD+ phosphorylase [Chromatiales bacterium]
MVTLYRIGVDTPAFGADDTTGEGARLHGGRWNRPETPMLYTSTTRALAYLEALVHLSGGALPLNRYLVELSVPDDLWATRSTFDPASHVGWDARPPGLVSMDWGDRWARGGSTLLAEVPSVVIPAETNVLVNPRHPRIGKVRARKSQRVEFDARLIPQLMP